jgi:hypothetical protein
MQIFSRIWICTFPFFFNTLFSSAIFSDITEIV